MATPFVTLGSAVNCRSLVLEEVFVVVVVSSSGISEHNFLKTSQERNSSREIQHMKVDPRRNSLSLGREAGRAPKPFMKESARAWQREWQPVV